MSKYSDYILVPRDAVVNIMETYGTDTISGTGNIYTGNVYANNFYGDGSNLTGVSGTGTSDHELLSGLSGDDHTQYILVDGTRAFTGDVTVNSVSGTNLRVQDIGNDGSLRFNWEDDGGYIQSQKSGLLPTHLIFKTQSTNGTTTDTLTLSGTRVGIGTNDPNGKLHISGDPAAANHILIEDTTVSGAMWQVNVKYDGDFVIGESGVAERFIIQKETGSVGIGVLDPLERLHLADGGMRIGDNEDVYMLLTADEEDDWVFLTSYSGSLTINEDSDQDVYIAMGGGDAYLAGDGSSVCIASSLPVGVLNIGYENDAAPKTYTNSGGEGLIVNVTKDTVGNAERGYVDFVTGRPSNSSSGGGGFRFFTQPRSSANPSETLSLHYNGNVGVGIVEPEYLLDVDGNANVRGNLTVSGTNDATTLDGLDSSSFVRSDSVDTVSAHTTWTDDNQVRLGTGIDMTLYHNGGSNFIATYNGAQINIYNDPNGENMASFVPNGEVKLYYDGIEKLSTKSYGALITGDLMPEMTGASGIVSSRDMGSPTEKWQSLYVGSVYAEGGSIYVNGKKVLEDDNDTIVVSTDADQALRVKTVGNGILYLDSDDEINMDSDGGLELNVSSTNSNKHINVTNDSAGGNITFYANGANGEVQFSAADEISLTAPTLSFNGDLTITGSLLGGDHAHDNYISSDTNDQVTATTTWQDNDKVQLGANGDMQIFHDGTNNYITTTNGLIRIYNSGSGEHMIEAAPNGKVSLYYNGVSMVTTENHGASVVGNIQAGNGAVATPTYSFTNSTDAGMYRVNDTALGFSVGGTQRFAISTTQVGVGINGSAAEPSLTINDSSSGRYRPNLYELGWATSGTHRMSLTNNGLTLENDLIVRGDLTVSGTRFITNTETVEINDNLLLINSGEVNAGVTEGIAGIAVDRGSLTNYHFQFDETQDNFRVGVSGTGLQAVATREDNPTAFKVPYWNNEEYRYDTVSGTIYQKEGAVGIGTAIPSAKLDVTGGHIYVDSNYGLFYNGTWGLRPYDGTNLAIYANNNESITINSSGNVGIGRTPSYKLDVEGGAYVRGDLTVTGTITGAVDATSVGGIDAGNFLRTDVSDTVVAGVVTKWEDGAEIRMGTGGDLRVWHNGSNSYIRNDTGSLGLLLNGEYAIDMQQNNSVTMYYDNSWRISTQDWGAQFNGWTRTTAGTESNPAYSFTDDSDTGMYRFSSNTLGFTTGGVFRAYLNDNGIMLDMNGSESIPAIRISDANTGFYAPAADQIGVSCGTIKAACFDTGGIRVEVSGSATTPAIRLNDNNTGFYTTSGENVLTAISGVQMTQVNQNGFYVNKAGTASIPALRVNDSNTGFYSPAPGQIAFSSNGVAMFNMHAGGLAMSDSTARLSIQDGTAASPGIHFANDGDTGLYWAGSGEIGFSANGNLRAYFYDQGLHMALNGTAAQPAIQLNDGNCGFYQAGGDSIGMATTGVVRAVVNDNGLYIYPDGSAATPSLRWDSDTGIYYNGSTTLRIATGGSDRFAISDSGINLATGEVINEFSSDTTLSGNSDTALPTEKAVKSYVDTRPQSFGLMPYASDESVATGSGTVGVCVPEHLNGYDITAIIASVHTAGTTNTTDIQVRKRRGTNEYNVLSTKCTIDSAETSSATAATPAVINTSYDGLATGDLIYVDIDAVSTTAPTGLSITITARI